MADIEELHKCPNQYRPSVVEGLKAGDTKYFCQCGLSKNQPWCDGTHRGTGLTPMKWTVPETIGEKSYICACKHTKNSPFCDGTHKTLKPIVDARIAACTADHSAADLKICTKCGFSPLVVQA